MELKFVILVRRDITMTGSNRTFMELKLKCFDTHYYNQRF